MVLGSIQKKRKKTQAIWKFINTKQKYDNVY